MLDSDIVCSLHGWLVLSNRNDLRSFRVFNPVSMATITLPLFTRPCCYDFGALSCDPNNPDCIVVLIKCSPGRGTFYFCRPGDVVWSEKDWELEADDDFPDRILAAGCYKDQICILTFFNKIFILGANPPYLTITNLGIDNIMPSYPGHCGWRQDYLVESDGKLFIIQKLNIRVDAYDFEVFKLDISGKKKRFVGVDDLGGRAFFLSSFKSGISCSVKNYDIKANTIYFTQPSDPCLYSFDLKNKTITFSLPCPNVKRNLVQAEWILPLPLNAPCKLDCKVDIVPPLQIKKFALEQPSISGSMGKDWSQLRDGSTNSHAKKMSSRISVCDWSELSQDVLILIAEKLSCVICARMVTVCKSWRSLITWVPKKLLGCPIFFHMPSSSNEVFHFVSNVRYNVPLLGNSEILSVQHAQYGWLLITKDSGDTIFFLNLLTLEKIEIPDLPDNNVRDLCFSSVPTSTDCSVLGIYEGVSCYLIYHIRRGEKEWAEVEIPEAKVGDDESIPYSNPVFHNGVFYWIWSCGNLCAYDTRKGVMQFLVEPRSPCKYTDISYLFRSEEKLMSLWVGRHGNWFRVYELDEASMAWKQVTTLEDKVVFLSRNSSLVIDCLEMPGFEDTICFNRFTNDNKPLMYSLKTDKLEVYGDGHRVIQNFCNTSEYQINSAWIKPNIKQHSVRELSW